MAQTVEDLYKILEARDPDQGLFKQAVKEVLETLEPLMKDEPKYIKIFEQMLEPERVIMFRIPWLNDKGEIVVNRGFRVEFNSAIGPYKGGMRFHPTVTLSMLKFLGFEQILKNSLTGLPMGGGKGGSDFDPKGKSNAEVMRFCQSLMTELYRHIGQFTDVPAGDIGVGGREIGYMFGQYKRIANEFVGVLTGKGRMWGGSLIRPEATGYGAVYFMHEMLKANKIEIAGKKCLVSAAGNVAQYAIQKLLDLGAVPLTASDSSGAIVIEGGWTRELLAELLELKNVKRGRIIELAEAHPDIIKFYPGKPVWGLVDAELAFPCACQNELLKADAEAMVARGLIAVSEGANMPSVPEACEVYKEKKIIYGPGKAANAGGVAVSGLEMTQNSNRLGWTREEVDSKLKQIMAGIFETCDLYAKKYGDSDIDYVTGANIGGFMKVAEAMEQQGCV